jgi:hypothetical protein
MSKGLLTALAVMLACTIIPVAQCLLAPLGPFIGAYFGMKYVAWSGDSYLATAAKFGVSLGVVSAAVLVIVAVALTYAIDMPTRFIVLTWIAVAVFATYVASMGTLGAFYRMMKQQNRAAAATIEVG